MRIIGFIRVFCLFLVMTLWPSVQPALANEKLVLILDWFANPNHAPIFVAKQQGFFSKQGLEVEIVTPSDPSDPPKWIALGRGDLAIDYQPHAILQMARGLPIKQVGTLIGEPLNCLVVLADSQIRKLTDLKGKTVAYSTPEIDLLMLNAMLQSVHLTPNDIKPINVHYDLTKALLSKQVAAAIGMMRNVELIHLRQMGNPGHAFLPEDYGIPPYSELIFIAHRNKVDDPRLKKFFSALNEAKVYLMANPKRSWKQFAKLNPEANSALNEAAWFQTLPFFVDNFYQINKAQCVTLANFLGKRINTRLNPQICQ
jgi:putative hydroxymethylpyrimidine transport system substrate-binding protein